ncbi:MAG: bacterioferritin-associated ferredoxin [Sulfuricaulis sp.]
MYVCVCKCVTDGDIREAVCEGACSMRELRMCLGVATQCGRCARHARQVLEETLKTAPCTENDKAA